MFAQRWLLPQTNQSFPPNSKALLPPSTVSTHHFITLPSKSVPVSSAKLNPYHHHYHDPHHRTHSLSFQCLVENVDLIMALGLLQTNKYSRMLSTLFFLIK